MVRATPTRPSGAQLMTAVRKAGCATSARCRAADAGIAGTGEAGGFDPGMPSATHQSKMRSLVISPFLAERIALAKLLRAEGHEVIAAADRMEGMALVAALCPHVVIADAQVPGIDGLALLRDLSRRSPMPRVILLCSRASCTLESLDVVCLIKPIDFAALHRLLVQTALEARST